MPKSPKYKNVEELKEIVRKLKADGRTVVFANGCFDILHGGHVSYLEAAKDCGDILIAALNSDASVHQLKGQSRPIIPEAERVEIIAAFAVVDYVVAFNEETCDALLETLRPDVHAKGTDYSANTVPERETTRALGIEIMIAGAPKQNASREIIASVRK